jgi:hypothetical protein
MLMKSGRFAPGKAFLTPHDPRYAFQNVQLIAAVIKSNTHDRMYLTRMDQMIVSDRMVIPIMGAHEFLE